MIETKKVTFVYLIQTKSSELNVAIYDTPDTSVVTQVRSNFTKLKVKGHILFTLRMYQFVFGTMTHSLMKISCKIITW